MARHVNTASEIIDAAGGTVKVARIFGVPPTTVSNWKLPDRRLPPDTYVVFQDILQQQNIVAPDHCWGMREAAE